MNVRYTAWWFHMYILQNYCLNKDSQHNRHFIVTFFLVAGIWKIYSLSILQVYKTVLLSIITMLYNRSQLIHLVTGIWYSLTTFTHFPHLTASGNHLSTVSVGLDFSGSTFKWDHTVLVFLRLTYFTLHNALHITALLYPISCGMLCFHFRWF